MARKLAPYTGRPAGDHAPAGRGEEGRRRVGRQRQGHASREDAHRGRAARAVVRRRSRSRGGGLLSTESGRAARRPARQEPTGCAASSGRGTGPRETPRAEQADGHEEREQGEARAAGRGASGLRRVVPETGERRSLLFTGFQVSSDPADRWLGLRPHPGSAAWCRRSSRASRATDPGHRTASPRGSRAHRRFRRHHQERLAYARRSEGAAGRAGRRHLAAATTSRCRATWACASTSSLQRDRAEAPSTERFDYVSTAYCGNGRRPTARRISTWASRSRTTTKRQNSGRVEVAKSGLPFASYRPGIVVGTPGRWDGQFGGRTVLRRWRGLLARSLPARPEPDEPVPVDFVVGPWRSSVLRPLVGKTYHLTDRSRSASGRVQAVREGPGQSFLVGAPARAAAVRAAADPGILRHAGAVGGLLRPSLPLRRPRARRSWSWAALPATPDYLDRLLAFYLANRNAVRRKCADPGSGNSLTTPSCLRNVMAGQARRVLVVETSPTCRR